MPRMTTNLDMHLSTDIETLAMQRKERFESLRKLQGLMERSQFDKPLGQDYLEEIEKRKEEEKRIRYAKAEKK